MSFNLSQDILLHIGRLLSKEDQLTCSTVCRQWKKPFQDVFCGTLNVSATVFPDICDVDNPKNTYKKNGQRVLTLRIHEIKSFDKHQIRALQNCFPNITHFDYLASYRMPNFIPNELNWSQWKSLTHLCVPLGNSILYFGSSHVFKLLSELPNLVHLTMKREFHIWAAGFLTCSTISNLHHFLPRLEYLETDIILKPIPFSCLEIIKWIGSASRVTAIKFENIMFNKMWMVFFAIKYPNIHTMSLGFFLNEDVAETYKQNRQLNLSREILSFLPHLRTLELGGLHSDPQIISAILEILNSFRVPLKRLDIHLLLDESETALKERVITLTKFFTRSLKILHLFMGYDRSRLANYTTVVGQYLQLVELHISNNGHSIEIDRLLDQCPRLESLMVSKAFLTFKQFDQDRPRPHNLSKLDLQSMNLCPKTMYYISWRCRQLRNLKLTSIRIREDCFDETRYVLLDIPFSQLNEITITDIICNTTHSRLFVIRQLESPKTNWYHLCKVRTGKKAMGCGWALDKDDISACEKYFEKFKPKPTPERFSNKISADHTYKLLPKTGWKKDRQNGFIKIRCRSVKNCYLSSLYCT